MAKYKFKDWKITETRGQRVTDQMREQRAEQIATRLSDNTVWFSHGRGISRETLQGDDIRLRIDDLGADEELQRLVREYHHCFSDFMISVLRTSNLVQSRAYL